MLGKRSEKVKLGRFLLGRRGLRRRCRLRRPVGLGPVLDKQILQQSLFLLTSWPADGHIAHQTDTVLGPTERVGFALGRLIADKRKEMGGTGDETAL